jgi:hypothetical protein
MTEIYDRHLLRSKQGSKNIKIESFSCLKGQDIGEQWTKENIFVFQLLFF